MSLARRLSAILTPSPVREAAVAAVAHDTGRLLVSLLHLREIDDAERAHLEHLLRRAIDRELDVMKPDDVKVTDARTADPADDPAVEAAPPQAPPSIARDDAPISPPPEQPAASVRRAPERQAPERQAPERQAPERQATERQAPVEVLSPPSRPAPVAFADILPDMAGRPTAAGRLAYLKTATTAEQAESARQWPGYEGHRGTLDGEIERMASTHRRIAELEGLGDIAGLVDLADAKTTAARPGLVQHVAAALERLRSASTHDQPAIEPQPSTEAATSEALVESGALDLDAIEAPV